MANELELIIQPDIETSIENVAKNMVENMKSTFFNFENSINKNIKNSINEVNNSIKVKAEEIKQTFKEATTGINSGWKNSNNFFKKSFNTNFRQIRINLKKSIRQMKKDMQDLKPPNQIKEGFNSLRNIIIGVFAVSSLKNFASESINLYKAQNLVETKLKANLKTVMAYNENIELMNKAFERLKNKASEIQEIGVIGDEVLLSGISQLSTFQLSEKSISKLLPGMADMLVNLKGLNATQEDAIQLANQLGKAISMGSLGDLRESGVVVDEITENMFKLSNGAERVALMEKVIADNVGKVNQAMAETPEGQIQQVSNAWGDIKEEIGKALIPTVLEFTKVIKKNLPNIQSILVSLAQKISHVIINIIKNLDNIKEFFNKLDKSIGIDNILVFIGAFIAMAKIVSIIMGIIKTVTLLKQGITLVNMAVLANPIALVIAGIGVALYQLWKNWDSIKEWFVKSFESISNKVSKLKETFLEGLGSAFKTLGELADTFFVKPLKMALNVVKSMIVWYVEKIQSVINGIINIVNKVGKYVGLDKIEGVDLVSGVKNILNVEKPETITKEDINKVNINNSNKFDISFTGNVSNEYKENITKFIKQENERELRRQEIEMGLV